MSARNLEDVLGQHIRSLRMERRLTQLELAERSNVSVGSLQHLERGAPATTTTLLKVLQALGREDWLDALAPASEFNPLQLLETPRTRTRTPRSRVRHRRPSPP
jgi:transcriptional regulator with XRE-family HTH domain